jgi:hypothetical protein
VLALPPEQLRLARRGSVDSDDLDRALRAVEALNDAADVDQLLAHRLDPPVALAARPDGMAQLIEMSLVGGDHRFEARLGHPAQHLVQRGDVEQSLALQQEGLEALAEGRRHDLPEALERRVDRLGQPLTKNYKFWMPWCSPPFF